MSSDINSIDRQKRLPDVDNSTEEKHKSRPKDTFQSPIFNLNIDCLNKIFDYLSLDDVHSIGQTCKVMQLVTGKYFQADFVIEAFVDYRKITYQGHGVGMHEFEKFTQNLLFSTQSPSRSLKKISWYVAKNYNQEFERIRFYNVDLTGAEIRNLTHKFELVKSVTIYECTVNRKFYEQFPRLCKNLRQLYIVDFDCRRNVLRRSGNEWLLWTYPELEHLHWTQSNQWGLMNEFKIFFKRNPKVRSFGTDINTLWFNRQLFSETGISLDDLTIEMGRDEEEPRNIEYIYTFLKRLYEKGVYKRLHIYLKCFNQRTLNEMPPLVALRSLCLGDNNDDRFGLTLPNWLNLTDLKVSFNCHLLNADILARQLVYLQQIYFQCLSASDLMYFVRHSACLTKVKVNYLDGDISISDLLRLNKEREKLKGAQKVIIYMEERFYLQKKCEMNGLELSLIEVRRRSSHEWSHHFIPFY